MVDLEAERPNMLDRLIHFCLHQKPVVVLGVLLLVLWGVAVSPFDWDVDWLPRDPVPVDAIPNLGENQQIVFAEWPGRSPQDVEDQVTYPLTIELLGVPRVEEVRAESILGASMVFVIFEEGTDFHWSRARLTEALAGLGSQTLPAGVEPSLGPDATALGQIFWYTLEGRDPDGRPIGGWELDELRSVQDWQVRYALASAEGVAEVASIGGYVSEYHVDVDPEALRAYDVTLMEVAEAARQANVEMSAGVSEINRVEYLVRGRGYIEDLSDLELATVGVRRDDVPIRIGDVAEVRRGPGPRRGVLTQAGAEAVGGVAVVREGYNPLEAIQNVRAQIDEIAPGLPAKVLIDRDEADREQIERFAEARDFEAFASDQINHEAWLNWLRAHPRADWPEWVTISQLQIVPFYDRTELIYQTLATLNDALVQQALVTVIVVIVLLMHLRSAVLVSAMLPLAVLLAFIGMKLSGIEANVAALAGIAISIGVIVDMGVIVSENIYRHLREAGPDERRIDVVYRGAREVGSAVLTAISTTVISFLPVLTLSGAEGRLFVPLAYTKTFVLIASVLLALAVLPAGAHLLVSGTLRRGALKRALLFGLGVVGAVLIGVGAALGQTMLWVGGAILLLGSVYQLVADDVGLWVRGIRPRWAGWAERAGQAMHVGARWVATVVAAAAMAWLLAVVWEPLGPEPGELMNVVFVMLVFALLLGFIIAFYLAYERLLRFFLEFKPVLLVFPLLLVLYGFPSALGFERLAGWLPGVMDRAGFDGERVEQSRLWQAGAEHFPGLGQELRPTLDEGSFLWMPVTMPHASMAEALEVLQYQDLAIANVPEVEQVVGKIGRVDSALDPAPLSMLESVVHYKDEYITDDAGRRVRFRYDHERGEFVRDEAGTLIEDGGGRPYRQWRDHIESPADIWREISQAAELPGVTGASPLQPIETRLLMLQSGMRAAMGVKVRGPDLETLEHVAGQIETLLRDVPQLDAASVNADRVEGKPYLEMRPDRRAISRYGLNVADVQETFAAAIGGAEVTTTVEGRQRFPVRVRYARGYRHDIDDMENVLIAAPDGRQIPLGEVAEIEYRRGPQMIRSEDTFLTAFVIFGAAPGVAPIDAVEAARDHLEDQVRAGAFHVPDGVSWRFAGQYEHHLQAQRTLMVVVPLALGIIFLLLYFQFRAASTAGIVFSGILVAWSGGFLFLYLVSQGWFMDFDVFGVNMRELMRFEPVNLSVAVWVGFLALFGIAVDDGVVMATYLRQSFARRVPESIAAIREATVRAGLRRVRPCLMTTATTSLALLPVLTSPGRGAEIMQPMALPILGGMLFVPLTMFIVPLLYCLLAEWKHRWAGGVNEPRA